ncbi:hypothetical protein M770_20200 [Pseudomonas aeruginosa VRFPA03]|nr:hypothetical protein M770_20200 [Pseudomonas aeruginosa VRFPA03]
MALLERGLKQRIVGALVLIALAVIFLPMLFTREDESRQVVVEAPPRPQAPAMPSVEVQPTEVPELQPGEEDIAPEIVEEGSSAAAGQPSQPRHRTCREPVGGEGRRFAGASGPRGPGQLDGPGRTDRASHLSSLSQVGVASHVWHRRYRGQVERQSGAV